MTNYNFRNVPRTANTNRQLTLNFSPIEFEDAEICVGIYQYQNKEQLRTLREKHGDTHVFHRDNKNQILCVSIVPEGDVIGDNSTTIPLSKNLYLCATLIRTALLNYLHALGRKILRYDPIEFISNQAQDNFLAKVLLSDTELPNWLSVKPLYTAAIRTVNFDDRPLSLGLALNTRTSRWIGLPCDALVREGFSLTGLYVSQLIPSKDSRMAPYLKILGHVQSLENGQLTLTDSGSGTCTVAASEVFLEPRLEAFNRCLVHLFGDKATHIKQALDKEIAKFRSGPTRLEKLATIIDYFARHPLEIVPGTTFTLKPFLTQANPQTFPAVHIARSAIYVFDPTGEKTSTWNDGGLNDYGPYTAQTFTPSKPRICVICQRTRRGRVEQFLYKFFNGVTVPKLNRQPFAKGFTRKYALDGAEYEFFLTEDNTAEAYNRAIRQALAHQTRKSFKWDLALVQIDEAFHQLYGDNNPYLTTKADFLAAQIPVQEFELETVDVPERNLCFVLNIMGLATYAKMGGIPWLIKANPTIAHELVFGLGSACIGEGRLGHREQVVGITTVFSGDGNYRLSNLSQAVPFTDYHDALLQSLRDTIDKVKRSMNWQHREHIRLIFHAFKPLKFAEAEAVKKLMEELGDYDVDYAFIHIIKEHPYILFDKSQEGMWDYETKSIKGVFAPIRGGFLRLSRSEVLLSLTGAKELKRAQDGIPSPVLLRLHRQSSFQDTTYLTRQVFTFSCHSWRSFFPSPMPVTIMYSELIAKMLGQLGTVSRWNPNAMLGRIGETRWFL
jgi:hypothetical protein